MNEQSKKISCIVLTIYVHPDYYPPTLNAIAELSKSADRVIVVTQKLHSSDWVFPKNVEIQYAFKSKDDLGFGSFFPLVRYYKYWQLLRNVWKKNSPDILIAHDPMAIASIWLLNKFHKIRVPLWYHNHDVLSFKRGLANKLKYVILRGIEKEAFTGISLFTLPSNERQKYFPLKSYLGKYYYLPNFPLKSHYRNYYKQKNKPENEIGLIYQGTISKGHGLENVINILNHKIDGKNIKLTIIGQGSQDYKSQLLRIAKENQVLDKLQIMDRVQYTELPGITQSHNIGLAIHESSGSIYSTGGTASNKIYEYAALGLPVILHENEHYRKHLNGFGWAFFVQLSDVSILNCIADIVNNYERVSKQAYADFANSLNYETHFPKVLEEVLQLIKR